MATQIGLAGVGFIGRGITTCFVANQTPIKVFDINLTDAVERDIEAALHQLVDHELLAPDVLSRWRTFYKPVASLAEMADCDFVIESVAENIEIKQKVFDELEAVIPPEAPLVSNTSAIPISLMQQKRKHPERFAGMHWAPPAHVSRFIEIIRGEKTSDATVERIKSVAMSIGKEPAVLSRDIEGFIINRLCYAMYREALHLLEQGIADAESIDRCWRNCIGNWAAIAGPFRWMDLTGNALYTAGMRRIFPTLCNSTEIPKIMLEFEKKGLMGTRDGQGFFTYTPEEAANWDQLLIDQSWRVRKMQDKHFPIKRK